MEQLNLVSAKEVYDEKDIIVKYRTKRGIQIISVEAKFHVTVNVVLGVNSYRNIAMGPGDRLDLIEEKDTYGATDYSYASFHTLRSNLLTQLNPSEVRQRNAITESRAIVEWDHYDPYEDIVVEAFSDKVENKCQVLFNVSPNDHCLNRRSQNGLSIDLGDNEESAIIKIISKFKLDIPGVVYTIGFKVSKPNELTVGLISSGDMVKLRSIATTINVDTKEVTELVLSEDEVESTKFIDLLKTIDLTAILRELKHPSSNPVKSLLAIK